MSKHLTDAEIRNLFEAAVSLGLTERRRDLFGGIHPGFVASLPVSTSPSAQLLTDLHELNRTERLADDSLPLAAWLDNALLILGPRRESELFERLLDRVGGGKKAPDQRAPEQRRGGYESAHAHSPSGNPWVGSAIRCLLVYVREDERMARALKKHLAPMEREKMLAVWDTSMVRAGSDFRAETRTRVDQAQLLLVLVSADLLASDDIDRHIIQPALRRMRGGLRVVPIVARACDYWGSSLRSLEPLPPNGEAITSFRSADEAFYEIVSALRELLADKRRPDMGTASTGPSVANAHFVASPSSRQPDVAPQSTIAIEQIFRVGGGMPDATYVEPCELKEITAALRRMGRGLVVQGASGCGKSTAVRKALAGAETLWLNGRKRAEIDRLIAAESITGHVVIDEFHRLDDARKQAIADLVKTSVDDDPPVAKFTLIGIPDARQPIFRGGSNLTGRVDIVRFGTQPDAKIAELIEKGERRANLHFSAKDELVRAAHGSLMVAQQICLAVCKGARIERSEPLPREVDVLATKAVEGLVRELDPAFRPPLIDFAASDPESDDAPRGLCFALLWLLAKSPEGSVRLADVGIQVVELQGAVAKLVSGELARRQASQALADLLYFGPDVVSIEDPQLGFYLRHLERIKGWEELAESARLPISFEEGRLRIAVTRAKVVGVETSVFAADEKPHFLDVPAYPFWDKRADELHRLLARAYGDAPRREHIAAVAEIDPGTWNNNAAPLDAWKGILEEASRQKRARTLVERVLEDKIVRGYHGEIRALVARPTDVRATS